MERLEVLKTYKLYIGGKFPRTESGRYLPYYDKEDKHVANICAASRKDFRNAIVAARAAWEGWAGRSAYNRGQIIYRIAEMLEGRKAQFTLELLKTEKDQKTVNREIEDSIDRLVHYAGWSDKYLPLLSTVNPVQSSYFNFSIPEPTGVVAAIASNKHPLVGLLSIILPVIVGGNTVALLASERNPMVASSFAEVLAVSDLPGGVVNILTGSAKELILHMACHMDVNNLIIARKDSDILACAQSEGIHNLKRIRHWSEKMLLNKDAADTLQRIADFQEIKTTWHPVGK